MTQKETKLPESAELFLTRTKGKIRRGEYSKQLKDIPFAKPEMLFALICNEVEKRVLNNENPLLSEREIQQCINDTIYVAGVTAASFLEKGIITRDDNGNYSVTEYGKKMIYSLSK